MKKNIIAILSAALLLCMGAVSCDKFLDRPAEDTYNEANFYQNDSQCEQGVNYLYNSPWYDVIRGFYRVGEIYSGNYYMQGSAYQNFSVNGSDQDLTNMSSSLWAVNANCTTVYNRLQSATCSEDTRSRLMGEVLTWKAFAYFFLVRSFGDVPIIHDIQASIAEGGYNAINKVQKADVYEYIVMTLEKAMELLPKKVANTDGRIDYYSAEALLAKVYLTKAGVSGSLSQADLDKAAEYAKDVIDNSGRSLLPEYSDIFRMKNNKNLEALISWHWDASAQPWTTQNSFQSDLGMKGFDEFGDNWGEWTGPSVDLQEAFGVTAVQDPGNRPDPDVRRKATMMLAGDTYSYFWRDKGGFDYLKFLYDEEYGAGGPGNLCCNTGASCVKFLYGNTADHVDELGVSPSRMAYGLSTHILRLTLRPKSEPQEVRPLTQVPLTLSTQFATVPVPTTTVLLRFHGTMSGKSAVLNLPWKVTAGTISCACPTMIQTRLSPRSKDSTGTIGRILSPFMRITSSAVSGMLRM